MPPFTSYALKAKYIIPRGESLGTWSCKILKNHIRFVESCDGLVKNCLIFFEKYVWFFTHVWCATGMRQIQMGKKCDRLVGKVKGKVYCMICVRNDKKMWEYWERIVRFVGTRVFRP